MLRAFGHLGIWALGLSAALWLAVGSLAAWGARRRGQRWRFAWLSGLFFPMSWVIWYGQPASPRASDSTDRTPSNVDTQTDLIWLLNR